MQTELINSLICMPEMLLLGMVCLILLFDVYLGSRCRYLTYSLSCFALLATTVAIWFVKPTDEIFAFQGMFIMDGTAKLLKIFACITAFATVFYSRYYVRDNDFPRGEFYLLILFSVLGAMVLVSAHNLLTIYLGLELSSLPLYALVALIRGNKVAPEAAMKYFVMGALASGLLLYGMSMLYGATGSLDIDTVARAISTSDAHDPLIFLFGMIFIVAGVGFKLGVVPFHMWVPDVYHGAPSVVTLFISSVPKIAAVGMLYRLLGQGMPSLVLHWQQLLIVLATSSIVLGNVVAISQTNIKRMLAYSAIAHMGYMMLGLLTGTTAGYVGSLFYIIVYSIMSVAAFGILVLLSRAGFEAENIEDFRGLNARCPWLAFLMMILMFSMAGIPPAVGFFAKLVVLQALVSVDLVWLAVVALVFSVVGAYYYLRIIKAMYFEEPTANHKLCLTFDMSIALTVNCLAILLLGILPGALLQWCQIAITT